MARRPRCDRPGPAHIRVPREQSGAPLGAAGYTGSPFSLGNLFSDVVIRDYPSGCGDNHGDACDSPAIIVVGSLSEAAAVRLSRQSARESELSTSARERPATEPGWMVVRILLADDHMVVRRGLRALFETRSDFNVCAEAADGAEKQSKLACCTLILPMSSCSISSLPVLNGIDATHQNPEGGARNRNSYFHNAR